MRDVDERNQETASLQTDTLQLYKCVKMGCAVYITVNKALINLSNTFLRMQFSKKQWQQKLIMLN